MAREMKESGLFWIKKIPDNWVIKKVKYVSKFKAGVGHEGEWDFEGEYIIVNSRFVSTNGHTKKYTDVAHALLNRGDICIVLSDLPNGRALSRCYYIEQNNRYTLNQRVGAFYDYSMNGKYFHYIMNRNYGLLKYDDGLNQTNLQYNNVLNCPIVVPPIQEQKKIADYLDKKCVEIDALETDIQSQINILEDYKKSVITEAVTKGLDPNVEMKDSGIGGIGKIPKDWKITRFKYIGIIKSNLVNVNLYQEYPQISPDNIAKDSGILLGCNTVAEAGVISDNHLFYKGQILYSKIRPKLNKVTIAPFDGLCSADMYPIETQEYTRFILYMMLSQYFLNQVALVTEDRVKMPKINQEELGEIKVVFPIRKTQKEIVEYLDQKCLEIDCTIENKKKQLEVLEQYKKALIYEHVTGKKEVPNNNG